MNNLIPLLIFALTTILTPGPNNFMILNSGLHFGIKKSLPHYFGICLGFPMMTLLVALGLGVTFTKYHSLQLILKTLGSMYMLYLAWKILRSNSKGNVVHTKKPLSFIQAILFQWVNPKAWIMAIGTISIFTITANYFNNALIISIVYLVLGLPCIGIWLLFGNFLQRILYKDTHRAWFNIIMAIGLIGSVGLIIID